VPGGGLQVFSTNASTGPNVFAGYFKNGTNTSVVGATISGGGSNFGPNIVFADFGAVGGGRSNFAGESSTIAGGEHNYSDHFGTVGGGDGNDVTGRFGTIAGGSANAAWGYAAAVPGGNFNAALGDFSFAAGRSARAIHNGTFVWSDAQYAPIDVHFESTGPHQFLIRAKGGVGITRGGEGHNQITPVEALDVDGNVKANGFCIGADCRSAWPTGGGTITAVRPLAGLTGGGTSGDVSLGVNLNVIQARVRDICGPGSAAIAVNQDGSLDCTQFLRLTGTLAPNLLTKITGPGTLASTIVLDDGTNVGVGTTTPANKLDVAGATRITASPPTLGVFPPVGALTVTNSDPNFGYGVVGTTSGSENGAAGVFGVASATATPGETVGVQGLSLSANGTGVVGTAYQSADLPGLGTGVFGQSFYAQGMGGAFQNTHADGISLAALNSSGDSVFSVFANGKTGIGTSA